MKDRIKEIERKRDEHQKRYGKVISTRLTQDLDKRLEARAKSQGKSKAQVVKAVLESYFEE